MASTLRRGKFSEACSIARQTSFIASSKSITANAPMLRFGDGRYGRRPASGTAFRSVYRVGNGIAGNIGAEALAHVIGTDVSSIAHVRNPLPARNGIEPESAESVRRRAPEAFRTQQRAVTPQDYKTVAEKHADVEKASARLRWTGSWHTLFVTVDRTGGAPADDSMRADMEKYLDRYRMAGHDIAFEEPSHVSLQLSLHVCEAGLFPLRCARRADGSVLREDAAEWPQGALPPGPLQLRRSGVISSALLAAAHAVPGVASVQVKEFGRQGDDDPQPLRDGVLSLGRREIARLDNDPNFPEAGALKLEIHGGK